MLLQEGGFVSKFEIEGLDELIETMNKLGELPQKTVTAAAKKGAKIVLDAAKQKAPQDDGNLIRGIILHGERKTINGKKVFDIMMDPKMADIFVKTTVEGKRYYYPASMEYGFIARDGKKIEGHHFLRDALIENADVVEKAVIEELSAKIDKELAKKG